MTHTPLAAKESKADFRACLWIGFCLMTMSIALIIPVALGITISILALAICLYFTKFFKKIRQQKFEYALNTRKSPLVVLAKVLDKFFIYFERIFLILLIIISVAALLFTFSDTIRSSEVANDIMTFLLLDLGGLLFFYRLAAGDVPLAITYFALVILALSSTRIIAALLWQKLSKNIQ